MPTLDYVEQHGFLELLFDEVVKLHAEYDILLLED
jgi:hypothetical protein